MSERGFWTGVVGWLRGLFPQSNNPSQWMVVEVEKGVPVANSGDAEAIASLRDHPGITALLNRFKLQRAVVEAKLRSVRCKELRDYDSLQLSLYWLGFVESQITAAVGARKKAPRLAVEEVDIFEQIRSSIEAVRTTSSE